MTNCAPLFSVVFVQRSEDDPLPPTGSYLGELTDELSKPYGDGSFISEFVSGGPKQYCFTAVTPSGEEKKVLKAKGITLNHNSLSVVNYNSMKEMVLNYLAGVENERRTINYRQIRKDVYGPRVLTVDAKKDYRVFYDKRVLKDGTSYPYGF